MKIMHTAALSPYPVRRAGDARCREGRKLVQTHKCETCHRTRSMARRTIYLRKDRKVTSWAKLKAQVAGLQLHAQIGFSRTTKSTSPLTQPDVLPSCRRSSERPSGGVRCLQGVRQKGTIATGADSRVAGAWRSLTPHRVRRAAAQRLIQGGTWIAAAQPGTFPDDVRPTALERPAGPDISRSAGLLDRAQQLIFAAGSTPAFRCLCARARWFAVRVQGGSLALERTRNDHARLTPLGGLGPLHRSGLRLRGLTDARGMDVIVKARRNAVAADVSGARRSQRPHSATPNSSGGTCFQARSSSGCANPCARREVRGV